MLEIPRDMTDPLGLHVQLAVLLAGEAERWRSRVTLEHAGRSVDACNGGQRWPIGLHRAQPLGVG